MRPVTSSQEHLARLLAEHVDDAVEDGVVEIRVVDGDGLDRAVERAPQRERGAQTAEALRRAVDADEDAAAVAVAVRCGAADDDGVGADATHHPVGDAAEPGLLHRAHPQRAHDHQVAAVRGIGDVRDQRLPVLPVEHPALEGDATLHAAIAHHIAVGVADQLQAGGDQAVVDAALAEELGLVLVLLGQRVLHLLEAVVVHPRGVHMASRAAGAERRGELDGDLDGRVGVLGVVEGDVDVPVRGRHHTPVSIPVWYRVLWCVPFG
jgi:hypothetical protein